MHISSMAGSRPMNTQKTFRHGQILKLVAGEPVESQDELRLRLRHAGMRVTQATLSRDLHELNLVKTSDGYKPLPEEALPAASLTVLARAARQFCRDIRPAQNLLVLKTPPGGAQPLAAALDAERWKEVLGTVAGDDTVLIIAASTRQRLVVQKKIEDLLR
jgi:transcriptional regulator of arginine metabolism